ncbi:Fur family transcriptional regulator [Aureimonas jatrophae]|uniref:Fur family transcriptional regulator, zinc uptake regulator n=1 Tax=Aureimonas jatrophae TaxID=1166073 RepID=A0A1H0J7N9_9HYPH|nr:Fur family transcriptional regulator [Aureimonas jatrophae]MBB3951549.1 Fur family zinc uptake transcriptional regulator [Aureimonas jatrophae]SDO39798.1 Fur family transcriptional regulator, zinc uptake regulator [Aureimonas jatrophae]
MTATASDDRPVTRNEELVLAALKRADAPQTAYQLLDALRDDGLKAPPQIYRALRSLGARHLVHRLDSLNAFVACAHHHEHDAKTLVFMICTNCGRVSEFTDQGLDRLLREAAVQRGFLAQDAAVEVRGLCDLCHAAADTTNCGAQKAMP